MKRALILSALALTALSTPSMTKQARAHGDDPILSLPSGQVILNISATERREVEQDLLVATLRYESTNRDSRALQNEINKAMAKALDDAKKVDTVKVNTGSYQVYEYTDNRTKERLWRGQQSLTLKSKNADDVLELAGKLQDLKLSISGLNYTLSPETAISIQDSLMEAALEQLQTRANRAAKTLGKTKAELRDVNVQGNNAGYQAPMMRAEMMSMASDKMAAPVAAAGETTITLTVSARAILLP